MSGSPKAPRCPKCMESWRKRKDGQWILFHDYECEHKEEIISEEEHEKLINYPHHRHGDWAGERENCPYQVCKNLTSK